MVPYRNISSLGGEYIADTPKWLDRKYSAYWRLVTRNCVFNYTCTNLGIPNAFTNLFKAFQMKISNNLQTRQVGAHGKVWWREFKLANIKSKALLSIFTTVPDVHCFTGDCISAFSLVNAVVSYVFKCVSVHRLPYFLKWVTKAMILSFLQCYKWKYVIKNIKLQLVIHKYLDKHCYRENMF